MSDLRDHSQPCEHDAGWYWEGTQARKIYQCNNAACPGGRVATIDLQSGFDAIAPYVSTRALKEFGLSGIHIIVAAALVVSDE